MLEKAIIIATMAHMGHKRKGNEIPYIFHHMEVGYILASEECREALIVAGILHDTIEDTDLTAESIEELFGIEIKDLVLGASESNRNVRGITWEERKLHTLEYLEIRATRDVKLVSCADKLSNIRSMGKDLSAEKDKLWTRFNEGHEMQKWYYEGLVK